MTATTTTVEQLATEAHGWLARSKRKDGTEYVHRKDDAPEWVGELCLAAHGDMMPDDWRYEFIEDALSALSDDPDGTIRDLDSDYPYTASRTQWLASHLDRPGLCDAAAEDYGTESRSVLALIADGMQLERQEVYSLVRNFLEHRCGE